MAYNVDPHRLSIEEFCEQEGVSRDDPDWLEELCSDSVAPALCTEGCEVEPDGTCEHNCPSVLIELGLI